MEKSAYDEAKDYTDFEGNSRVVISVSDVQSVEDIFKEEKTQALCLHFKGKRRI